MGHADFLMNSHLFDVSGPQVAWLSRSSSGLRFFPQINPLCCAAKGIPLDVRPASLLPILLGI